MFTKFVFATAAAALISTSAFAADLPARTYTKAPVMPTVFNWTGFYIGGFVGGAFADGNARATEPSTPGGVFYNGRNLETSYELDSSFIGGGTIGYNWQAPGSNYVFGVEGEAGYLHLRGSRQDVNAVSAGFVLPDSVNSTRIGDAYGVIAGRIGYTWDRTLLYAKGGVAFVGNTYNFTDACTVGGCGANTLLISHSGTDVTYALGAGIEYAFTNNWSMKGEYLYLGTRHTITGSGQTGFGVPTTFTNSASDPGVHTVKLGVNYRWGGPIVAKY
jgi:outer membrane immunogenic protein